MPAANAATGFGAKFGIKGAGATYDYVANVTSISVPSLSRDTVEVTHLESAEGYKEYIGALKDGGEATITINFLPAANHILIAAFADGADDYRILAPSGTAALDFYGIVTAFSPSEMASGDAMTATLTIKVSGEAEWVVVS